MEFQKDKEYAMVYVLKHLPERSHLYYGAYSYDPAKDGSLNEIYNKYPTDIVLFEDFKNELDYHYIIVLRFKDGSKGSEKLHKILWQYEDLQFISMPQYSLRPQGSGRGKTTVLCKEVIHAVPMKPDTKKHFGGIIHEF
jgi:hypothetical protein